MKKSICASLEASILEKLRSLEMGFSCVGLLEVAAGGTLKQEDLSSVQVRVFGVKQPHESMSMFSVTAEVRLNVEQAETANGELFAAAYEALALYFERIMIGDGCVELETSDVDVDGLQMTGGDLDFDTTGCVWYAVWNMTIHGRIK
jgi:hypothetical protein